jgi:hypothetical protein
MANVSFDQLHGAKLLTLVFQMIKASKLRLFEYDELLSLQIDHGLVAEFEFQSLIL